MSKIVFFCIPAHGHTNPTLGVVKELAFSTKILVDTTLALDEMVCRDMESLKPDCIVADFRTGRRSKTGFQYGSRYLSIKK